MITVIMVSYLGKYPGSRNSAESKFIRAVRSFLDQTLTESELIIVADGCRLTQKLWQANFIDESRVKFFMQPKSKGWPGEHRQFAIDQANYDIITYLDSDDILEESRLAKLAKAMSNRTLILDTIYTVPTDSLKIKSAFKKIGDFRYYGIGWTEYLAPLGLKGTYQLCHRRNTFGVKWTTTQARGEDSKFITDLAEAYPNLGRADFNIPVGGYLVCHSPQFGFDC